MICQLSSHTKWIHRCLLSIPFGKAEYLSVLFVQLVFLVSELVDVRFFLDFPDHAWAHCDPFFFLSFYAENMQINCEASLKCLQGKGFPCNFQSNGSSMEGFTELKNEPGTHPAGDVADPNCHLGSEFLEPSNEFHTKPTYHQNYSTWTPCHFNSHKVQQCQMNAFESHYYPYPVENPLQYVPINMVAQGYPREQYQEFQYFVVIDFEATCDKDKNPHPDHRSDQIVVEIYAYGFSQGATTLFAEAEGLRTVVYLGIFTVWFC